MIIYISATILSIFFAYLAINSKSLNKNYSIHLNKSKNFIYKFFAFASFLPLFLVSAFRYNVGTDYFDRYVMGLVYVKSGNQKVYEIGFRILNQLILVFTDKYIWIFIITSFLFCAFVYKAIYEQSNDIYFSIILLVITNAYFISLNAVRQSICIGIFLYAIKYIKSNSIKKYMICIGIASTIHLSSLVYIPVYFLGKLKVKINIHIVILTLIIIFSPFISKFFIYIIYNTKYAFYFSTSFNSGKISFWKLLINVSVLLLCYILYNKCKNNKDYIIFTNLQFLSVMLLMLSNYIPLIDRIVMYFTFSQIIFLPNLVRLIKQYWTRHITKICIIVFYAIYMVNTIVLKGYEQVLPYQNILMK